MGPCCSVAIDFVAPRRITQYDIVSAAALLSIFAPLLGRSPAKGAEMSIYLASSPSVEGITGKYFYDLHVIPAAPQATDIVIAGKLWEVRAESNSIPARVTCPPDQ